jgi:acetate kinase
MSADLILVLNGGSSSVKYGLFDAATAEQHRRGAIDDLGPFLDAADWGGDARIAAIGHRIVHGGPRHRAPEALTPATLDALRAATPLAPDHLPGELAAIDLCAGKLPGVPQFACYDTWFHRTLPRVARLLPIPRRYADADILRFGFHGISYEWIADQLATLDPQAAGGRAVVAHLGGGASLAALDRGVCVDTTMGFTPAGGIMMGTRPGDLDPGTLLFLLRQPGMTVDQLDGLVNRQSGLAGVSGCGVADMRRLLALIDDGHVPAREAVELFCRSAAKGIAAMAVSLGGIDTLVFTGGIGEHTPRVRAAIAADLAMLGVRLDPARDACNAPCASPDGAAVTLRIIPTDEERQVARHVARLLAEPPATP